MLLLPIGELQLKRNLSLLHIKLVGRSSPYCGDMWKTYCCLTSLFPIVDTCLRCEDIARQSCAMVPEWRFLATFLRPVFSASRVQHVSDLHLKFALRPHHVWKCGIRGFTTMRYINLRFTYLLTYLWQTSNLRQLRLGEEKKKEKEHITA